ncbi:MAG TPA: 2-oxo-4-hydroxy-4-carboxy-5-ureidoimidazoline decarboxylase [Stellaceae bacterium]|nr:2-oxo-4-hydroxy-4-carboxy-5-ureidoimidazoline decarboxylase [Stellaceae bacterium]
MADGPALALEALNAIGHAEFLAALGNVYEHAPRAAESAFAARPFATVAALYAAMRRALRLGTEVERLALLRGHPELARKQADLTQDSAQEQTGVGLDRLSEAEFAAFERLNESYRAKFGFPFIICVRRHTKDSILASFERRLANAGAAELETALDEVDRIAALRLDALVKGEGPLAVSGCLSTHVLDTHGGRPATGISVTLIELSRSGAPRVIARAVTNADGRTDAPLIEGRPVPIGRYELSFAVGDYFSRAGVPASDPPFLDMVPIRFGVGEPEGRYHVPLLVTPWSYATYRGS